MIVQQRAIVVGVNECRTLDVAPLRYAEADAVSVYQALTDESTGTFDTADVVLLTGSEATTSRVKDALMEAVLASTDRDFLLVYFAGHGVLPESSSQSNLYLASHDLSIDNRSPEAGLRLSFLRNDVFAEAPCPSLLILDCCHAGGYLEVGSPHTVRTDRPLTIAIDSEYHNNSLSRHSALIACPYDAVTREGDGLGHGIFTHHLLRGLAGEASADGAVTLEELSAFLSKVELSPPPGRFVQAWSSATVLTRPGYGPGRRPGCPDHPITTTVSPSIATLAPLDSPLAHVVPVVDYVTAKLESFDSDALASMSVAQRLQIATGAEVVAEVETSATRAQVTHASGYLDHGELAELLSYLSERRATDRRHPLGWVCRIASDKTVVAVRLGGPGMTSERHALLVSPTPMLLDAAEPLAVVLSGLSDIDPDDALPTELRIWSELRRVYGRIPIAGYQQCFRQFSNLVHSLHMVFEPVVTLTETAGTIGVSSWEALARLKEGATSAPAHIFELARLWGDRYLIELDSILAAKALESYSEAHATGPWSHDTPKPVSINVAIRSLVSEHYVDVLRNAMARADLGPRKVTLEISEKDPIEAPRGEVWLDEPHRHFGADLARLSEDLDVSFAVDDFGVGQSSLHRIATLNLTQIKVDRAILSHDLAIEELKLVLKLAKNECSKGRDREARPVVVEGYEEPTPVSLHELYEAGIRYIQGYITERATPELRPLSKPIRERIELLTKATV